MADEQDISPFPGMAPLPTAEDVQQWTEVMVRAQTMLAEHAIKMASASATTPDLSTLFDPARWQALPGMAAMTQVAANSWAQGMENWQKMLGGDFTALSPAHATDKRFAAPEWTDNPVFAILRQSYAAVAEQMLGAADMMDGIDPGVKAKLRFATQNLVDAMAPSNLAFTNPQVMERAIATRGESLLKGLEHLLGDMARGQMTHVDRSAFTIGQNIAATPGKVVHETPLYQLIHYAPTTPDVLAAPLVVFPPWINRFYILDLNPAKSFVKYCVDNGISLFMVSWKSADASLKDVVWDDYIAAQIDAIDTVRARLDVPAVHAIGYCVAGTTLAATLAVLAAKGEPDKVASATFFTAQVDFELAGDLKLFVDEGQLALLEQLSAPGFLDGRYMAATFNLLRGRDLIWNYVVSNYLMGQDYPAFDLLYWNGDTTNLPAKWHRQYLTELYRDNRLVVPGSLSAQGVPIDLRKIQTPAYVQAGREDHIAPAESVWRIMHHLAGPKTFVLAGSGHIAGVVNPPAAGKYQYWTGDSDAPSLRDFVASATETKGSWWPHWLRWLQGHGAGTVPAKGARIPGGKGNPAIEDAPGRYVKAP
ncbi:MAG: alpha/beta fold hydrolase [Sphingopyxis sp.]|nr:alpha/beta fold hydrolase [Sphingopyxis sp.]